MRKVRGLLWVLVAWTAFVWIGRVRNLIGDDGLTSSGRIWRIFLAAVFLGFAALSVSTLGGRWRSIGSTRLIAVFCIWTITFWVVRGTGILFADHDAAFKAVHSILALVSIAIAVPLYRLDQDFSHSVVADNGRMADDR
ncbi:MAG: hypothetical protein ISR43_08260 [Acidimicrobiia bacterium]|nr:hypothetical protein [Actinomycetota bacterium]MBL6924983.1 hypothetical protein [Acidimicrobiia bacterium]MBL6927205.1 hypothetical protein [Acidimicrobiia bacterium]